MLVPLDQTDIAFDSAFDSLCLHQQVHIYVFGVIDIFQVRSLCSLTAQIAKLENIYDPKHKF